MSDLTLIDYWRLGNALLAAVAFVWLTIRLIGIRNTAPPRIMLLLMALDYTMLILVCAGLSNVFFTQPLVGISMASTVVIWILYALMFTPPAFPKHKHSECHLMEEDL